MTDFPDVPVAPGVPPVARDGASVDDAPALLTGDDPSVAASTQDAVWGLFDSSGALVLKPDTFVGVDPASGEWKIPDYPTEEGAFQSYNKVQAPLEAKVTMSTGGDVQARASFLADARAACASLDLYTLVMPDGSFENMNALHFDITRTRERGATMMTIGLWLKEIRNTATATFTNTQTPAAQDPVNDGGVQPVAPSATVQTTIASEQVT